MAPRLSAPFRRVSATHLATRPAGSCWFRLTPRQTSTVRLLPRLHDQRPPANPPDRSDRPPLSQSSPCSTAPCMDFTASCEDDPASILARPPATRPGRASTPPSSTACPIPDPAIVESVSMDYAGEPARAQQPRREPQGAGWAGAVCRRHFSRSGVTVSVIRHTAGHWRNQADVRRTSSRGTFFILRRERRGIKTREGSEFQ
jgi:hypothetical protein